MERIKQIDHCDVFYSFENDTNALALLKGAFPGFLQRVLHISEIWAVKMSSHSHHFVFSQFAL